MHAMLAYVQDGANFEDETEEFKFTLFDPIKVNACESSQQKWENCLLLITSRRRCGSRTFNTIFQGGFRCPKQEDVL